MKKPLIFLVHCVYWAIYLALSFSFISLTNQLQTNRSGSLAQLLTVVLGIGALHFFCFYSFLVPKFLAQQKIKPFIVSSVAVCVGFSIVVVLLRIFFSTADTDSVAGAGDGGIPVIITWILIVFVHTALFLVNGFMATLMRGAIAWYDEIHIKEVLISKNLQTELALLKAQLNPHFLFNTLNNIDVLIDRSPEKASIYLKKLSDILRFMLYDSHVDVIPLKQELEYISKYIDLQIIRTANAKFVSYKVQHDSLDVEIAPMLFIPFIENAFKHSTDKKK
ncbi:MAG: hypothetical protein DI538_27040, partial [Azospira oryzae]